MRTSITIPRFRVGIARRLPSGWKSAGFFSVVELSKCTYFYIGRLYFAKENTLRPFGV